MKKSRIFALCFYGIRFKVNERLVVEMTTFFFLRGYIRSGVPPFQSGAYERERFRKNTILFFVSGVIFPYVCSVK